MWTDALTFANGAGGAAVVAIPVLALLLGAELLVSVLLRRDGQYQRTDTVTNLALNVGNVLVGKAWGPLAFAAYTLAHRLALFDIPSGAAWAWALLFVGDDFLYYWSHRAAHGVPVLWASHQVHHTSRCFNLSVGARHSWTGGMLDWIFWLPLAVVGYPPAMIVAMQGISLIWQFLVHTAYGGRLGLAGFALNTPAHHRVHHGRNPRYLDRNFGGTLIVWDRLFGTFSDETEPVRYGTPVPPAHPGNPFFIAFAGWAALLGRVARFARFARPVVPARRPES